MSQGNGPVFHLNLSGISKAPPVIDDLPPIPTKDDPVMNQTIQPARKRPEPTRASVNRKNLVVNNSDSSDEDLDLDLVTIGIGKAEQKEEPKDEEIQGPVTQMSVLPDLDDGDDMDDEAGGEKSTFSLLYDFLLTPEQYDEPPGEWSYAKFIKSFARNEANAEDNDDEEDGDDELYDNEEDYEDENE